MPFDEEEIDLHGECAAEIKRLQRGLDESVKLQSHYASILNMYDQGVRSIFRTSDEWLARLDELKPLI